MDRPYHHGELRTALLEAAIEAIAEHGAGAMSLRDVARRSGVSHTAAAYHYRDRAGLLTAVAVDGYELLAATMAETERRHGSFLEVGVSYVRFAISHPAHFEVMFQPRLHDVDDADLTAAKAQTARILYGTTRADHEQLVSGVAAWSIVHGLATLWINGNLPPALGDDPEEIARIVASHFRGVRT